MPHGRSQPLPWSFPTPPLPATTTTRDAVNDCSEISLSGGTFAQTSDRHARRPCRGRRCGHDAGFDRARPGRRSDRFGRRHQRRTGTTADADDDDARRRGPGRRVAGERSVRPDPAERGRIGDRSCRRRGVPGVDPPGEQQGHAHLRRRGRGPARADRRRTGADRRLGRPDRRPVLRHRRPDPGRRRRHRDGPRRTGRLHRRAARPARHRDRLRCRRGAPPQRIGRALRRPLARHLQAADRRRGHPDRQQHGAGTRRVRGERRRAVDHRPRRARRRVDPVRHDRHGAIRQAVTRRPAVPHGGQPAGRLSPPADRARAARLRVLHGRGRHRRRGRRGVHRARLYGCGRASDPTVGVRADRARHAGLRHRRASGDSQILDGGRDLPDRRRQPVPVRTVAGHVAAPVVARAARPESVASR